MRAVAVVLFLFSLCLYIYMCFAMMYLMTYLMRKSESVSDKEVLLTNLRMFF